VWPSARFVGSPRLFDQVFAHGSRSRIEIWLGQDPERQLGGQLYVASAFAMRTGSSIGIILCTAAAATN
jgi:hypothetical protein